MDYVYFRAHKIKIKDFYTFCKVTKALLSNKSLEL